MAHVILREGWADEAFIAARTENFAAFADALSRIHARAAALVSACRPRRSSRAARIYALGERQHGKSKFQDARGHSTILYAMGITQRTNGTDLVMTLANLAMLCGQIGKPATGVNPLRGQANVQGACDVGCLLDVLPGYQLVTDEARRARPVARAWGLDELPGKWA